MIFSSRAFQIARFVRIRRCHLAVAGCGGGGTSSTPVAVATATPTATPTGGGDRIEQLLRLRLRRTPAAPRISPPAPRRSQYADQRCGRRRRHGCPRRGGRITRPPTIAMTAQLATGTGDITANTSTAFPPFATTSVVDTNGAAISGTYTLVDYLKLTATPAATFTQTPGITISGASVAGEDDLFVLLAQRYERRTPQWQQAITTYDQLSGTITFTAQTLAGGEYRRRRQRHEHDEQQRHPRVGLQMRPMIRIAGGAAGCSSRWSSRLPAAVRGTIAPSRP